MVLFRCHMILYFLCIWTWQGI